VLLWYRNVKWIIPAARGSAAASNAKLTILCIQFSAKNWESTDALNFSYLTARSIGRWVAEESPQGIPNRRSDTTAQTQRVQVTGAGDCFAAACLHARFVQQLGWPQTLRFANRAAALSTQGYGAQTALPTFAEVETALTR
jgi:bifunctional ADP-heptose synthase (sugar kinase/adenylyltransferase)